MAVLAVVAWWFALALAVVLGAPIAAALFAHCERRGAGFAPTIAVVVVTLVAYWVGHLAFGWIAPLAGVGVLAGLAAVATRRTDATVDRGAVLETLALFTVAFLALVGARLIAPDVTPAGEQFLDFALLKALLRSGTLPPEDPWFAGSGVAYYYGGHLTVALLARLTATPARYAYHLGSAGALALLATGVYELAASIAPSDRRLSGLVAVFLVGGAGNLVPAVVALLSPLSESSRTALVDAVVSRPGLVADMLRGETPFRAPNVAFVVDGGVSMFPALEALTGYMHAHVLATPLLGLVAGLGLAYVRTPANEGGRRWAILAGAIAPVTGLLALTSTWSLPTAVGITFLAVVMAPALPRRRWIAPDRLGDLVGYASWDLRRDLGAGVVAGVVGILAIALVLPFFLGPAASRSVGLVPDPLRTELDSYLVVQGPFLAVFATVLLGRLRSRRIATRVAASVLVLLGVAALLPFQLVSVPLFGSVAVLAWYHYRTDALGYPAVLIVAGAAVLVVPEFFYVVTDGVGNRFNTVYKASMQAWVLWATAAGALLPAAVRGLDSPWIAPDGWGRRVRIGVAVLLVVSMGVYLPMAVDYRVGETNAVTLDATDDARRAIPYRLAAIEWLDDTATDGTLLSAPGQPMYTWRSSPGASLAGVPTVVGWAHEAQYRGREPFDARIAAVDRIYEGSDETRADRLATYEVRWIWVGPAERHRYGEVRAFDSLEGVSIAYRNDRVTIYRVDLAALPADSTGENEHVGTVPDPTIRISLGTRATRSLR